MSDFYHLGFVMQDIEQATRDLTRYRTHDIGLDQQRLVERGAPVEFDGCPYGRAFSYHHVESLGIRLELVDTSLQADWLDAWNPGGDPMPALELDDPPGRR